MTVAVLLLVMMPFALAFMSAMRTGRSVVRFPRPTYRDENPLSFWLGQTIFAAAVLGLLVSVVTQLL
jgi:hypothetical protein